MPSTARRGTSRTFQIAVGRRGRILAAPKADIHLNPVFMASVVKNHTLNDRIRHLRAYPWSSYRLYVGLAPAASWISCQPVLAMMGERNARKNYAKFVESGIRGDG